jgi:DNA-binding protein HU-beta
MNRRELITRISKKTGLKKSIAKETLNSLQKIIGEELASGEKVTISGFGTFSVSKRAARSGVLPQAPHKRIQIPAKAIPHFRAGRALKRRIA